MNGIFGAAGFGIIAFGVFADLAFNLFSAMCSSPQTTELFAADRAATLWKYVKIADVAAVGFGLFATAADFGNVGWWPLIGSLVVVGIMHYMYRYALKAGRDVAPPASAAR